MIHTLRTIGSNIQRYGTKDHTSKYLQQSLFPARLTMMPTFDRVYDQWLQWSARELEFVEYVDTDIDIDIEENHVFFDDMELIYGVDGAQGGEVSNMFFIDEY
jgi:hypothetical protein